MKFLLDMGLARSSNTGGEIAKETDVHEGAARGSQ
jgi:hypothetical protein